MIKLIFSELENHDYLREPIPFGKNLSDEKRIKNIINGVLNNIDINFLELLMKNRLTDKKYIEN